MPVRTIIATEDLTRKVYFWAQRDGDLKTTTFCCPNVTEADRKKILRSFRPFLETGNFPKNPTKYKYVEDGLYEVKPTSQLRLLGMHVGQNFVVVHCIRKKQQKLPPAELEAAKNKMGKYYEEARA
jgi:phage-related protein